MFASCLNISFLFDLFTNKARKLKVEESIQASASFNKTWLATDKANGSPVLLRAIRPKLVGYVYWLYF